MAAETECPTGRYATEIVTAGGLTLKHPTEDPGTTLGAPNSLLDWSGSEVDYAEWHSLGETLIGRLEIAWRAFKGCPGTASFPVPPYNDFLERINDVRDRWSRLRVPWRGPESAKGHPGWTWGIALPDLAWDSTDDIGKLTGLLVDSQCLRQRLDEATVAMGCPIDGPGDTGHTANPEGLGFLGTALLVSGGIALVAGTYYVAKRVMK